MGIVSTKAKLKKQTLKPDPKPKSKNGKSSVKLADHRSIEARQSCVKDFRVGFTLYHSGCLLYLIGHNRSYHNKKQFKVFLGQIKDGNFLISPTVFQPIGDYADRLELLEAYYNQPRQAFLDKCSAYARKHS